MRVESHVKPRLGREVKSSMNAVAKNQKLTSIMMDCSVYMCCDGPKLIL